MKTKDLILDSLQPVLAQSHFVTVNHEKIFEFAQKIKDYPLPGWDNTLQFFGDPNHTAQYYFFLDSINFCFWAKKGTDRWAYQKDGEWLHGYYAYSYAIKRALEQNSDLFDAKYLSQISFQEFANIFQGKNQLLLMKERYKIITENFRILLEKFDGQAANLIKAADHDVNKLVHIILETFPTYQDVVVKGNQKFYFLKRAQIFVSDLYNAFQGKGLGQFNNLADLAIFADYKLPQLFQAQGILIYNKELLGKIRDEILIRAGSDEEIEIRAFTIYASELLRQELEKMGRKLNSNELDWLLWVEAKQTKFVLPHHKTLTTFY